MIRKRIAHYIKQENLFCPTDKILVTLSGGADSVALIHLLLEMGYRCEAAHCNFHLRGEESDRDERFVDKLCQKLNIPLHIRHFNTNEEAEKLHISIEMAARQLRYTWFEELRLRIDADVIATAHHKDDSVETFLLNLIRGTGINGLLGIHSKNGCIVRPLLCVNRNEIEYYLNKKNQLYVTDSTNLQDEFTRNKIRLNIIPLLQEINPSVQESIMNTAKHLKDASILYRKGIEEGKQRVKSDQGIIISALLSEPAPETLLFEMLSPLGFNSTQINDIFYSLNGQSGKTFISKEWRVIKDRDQLLLAHINTSSLLGEYSIDDPALPFCLLVEEQDLGNTISFLSNQNIAYFDADKLKHPLKVRRCRKGDSFIPFGLNGRKKVSDFLTNKKFSLFQKENQWVLCSGEDIAWLIGERTDNRFKIDDKTKKILIIRLTTPNSTRV